jgi:hypothetical protein
MSNRMRALALALTVGACTLPALAAPSIAGVGDVAVRAFRFVPAAAGGPGFAAAGNTYVVATVALTNASTRGFTPSVSRFFLTAGDGERYQGTDSGSSVFVGVANSHAPLEPGERREYTVGFLTADPVAAGTVSYEP